MRLCSIIYVILVYKIQEGYEYADNITNIEIVKEENTEIIVGTSEFSEAIDYVNGTTYTATAQFEPVYNTNDEESINGIEFESVSTLKIEFSFGNTFFM